MSSGEDQVVSGAEVLAMWRSVSEGRSEQGLISSKGVEEIVQMDWEY